MNLMVELVSRAWVRDNILTEYHIHDLDTCSWSHKPQLHVALFCCGCYTQMTTIAEVYLHLPQFLYQTVINMLCDWHTLARNKNCDCLGRNAVFLSPGHKIIQCFDPQHLSSIHTGYHQKKYSCFVYMCIEKQLPMCNSVRWCFNNSERHPVIHLTTEGIGAPKYAKQLLFHAYSRNVSLLTCQGQK